jgi:hypothetical protein
MREYERRRRWTPWHVLAILLILGVLVVGLFLIYRLTDNGPTGSVPSQIAAGPSPTASPAADSPTATLAPAATASPTGNPPAATQRPVRSQLAETPAPPDSSLSEFEASLRSFLREDAGVDCAARREGLPPGATAGIECTPGTEPWPDEGWDEVPYGVAERVGAYMFPGAAEAALAYLERMTEAGVPLRQDGCSDGREGDTSYVPGDGERGTGEDHWVVEYRGEFFNADRLGCFVNENGVANVRVTCSDGVYVGVLGRDADVSMLYEWTIQYPPYRTPDIPTTPGICIGPDSPP